MIGLLFGFASLRAGSALEHTFSVPASIRKLETFTANEAVTVDGVLLLQFVKFLPFHWDSKFSKNWRGMRVLTSQAIRLPPSIP